MTPADLATKLRFISIIIGALFGGMVLLASLLSALDERGRRAALEALKSPELQFREGAGGAWLWRVEQKPMLEAVGAAEGPFVRLAAALGVPAVRLAAAIPPEFLSGAGDPGEDAPSRGAGITQMR